MVVNGVDYGGLNSLFGSAELAREAGTVPRAGPASLPLLPVNTRVNVVGLLALNGEKTWKISGQWPQIRAVLGVSVSKKPLTMAVQADLALSATPRSAHSRHLETRLRGEKYEKFLNVGG